MDNSKGDRPKMEKKLLDNSKGDRSKMEKKLLDNSKGDRSKMEKKLLDNSKDDRSKMPNKHLSSIFLSTIVQWIQQHQDSEYVGRGIDVLWYLVVGEKN
ncbi:MAG: hypothetical protein F6K18_22325 [Okeania sp. SIO2C2]|nr:hypothetical protein [Okeania sp. SIO2C2]